MPGVLLKLLMLSVLKKVAVFAVAKTYGFPRLYRRLMEVNRKLFRNDAVKQAWIRDRVQYAFRLPRILAQRFYRRPEQLQKVGLLICLSTGVPDNRLRVSPGIADEHAKTGTTPGANAHSCHWRTSSRKR
jgi:hypothetical protein